MSLRSPLRNVTGLGSAKGGAHHWYVQRVTAVALVLLGLWFVVSLATLDGATHEHVAHWLASPLSSGLAVLFVAITAWHAVLGVQVVIEDYVADKGRRMILLLVAKFALVAAAVVGVVAVLRIAFGAAG
jgi:succinate dehydrogenase / fumarate reductase membrane anchor subunit